MKFKLLRLVMKESVEKESVLRRVAAEETLEESKKEELVSKMEDPDNFKDLYYFSTHINDIEKIIDNCKDKKKLKTYKNVLKAARAFESGRKKKNMNESAEDRYQVREFDGPGAKFGVYDTKAKKFVQKGAKYIMNAACNDLNSKNSKKLKESKIESTNYTDLKIAGEELWGDDARVYETRVDGIYNCDTARHGGYLVDTNVFPELAKYGDKTSIDNIVGFEEDYEALKVIWVVPEVLEQIQLNNNWYKDLTLDKVLHYEDSLNDEFRKEFPNKKELYKNSKKLKESINTDIKNIKQKLINKAKKKGSIWENFGQDEVRKLKDKYFDDQYANNGVWDAIQSFDDWCMNFNLKEESNTYKDKDEAEYYRNKELYKNSNLARHRDAMNKAKKSCGKKGIKLKEEETSFEEIINEMENATEYEELYNAAEKIANVDLKEDVIKFIQQCEDDGDSVEEAYSIVTSDLLDDKTQDLNEDAYITINDGGQEADYMIQDVTELEDVDDDTVEAPSVEGLLSLVNESLNNKYGTAWGYIKSKSISMKENLQYAIIDIVTPSVLREAEENKIKDKAVSKTIILESVPNSKSLVNLKVNTLAGTTRFSQKTREPAKVLTRWLESEYLYDEMVKDFQDKLAARQATLKDSTESYLKQHPDLKVRIDVIKAQEKMLKDAGMLENSMDDLARTAYGIAAEFPANIKVDGNKDNEYNMEFDTIDEIVKILFGESYVRDIPKEEKELAKKNKKVLKDNLKESELTYDENGKAYPENFTVGEIEGLYDHNTGLVSWHYSGKGNNRLHTSAKFDELPDEEFPHTDKGKIKAYIKQHFLQESEKVKEYYIIVRIMNKYNKCKEGFLGKNNEIVDEEDALTFNSRAEAQKALRRYNPGGYYTLIKSNIESRKKLKESYETFNIGDIEGTFNTSTGEILYSIPSKNVTDKKVSLDKIPSTDTPYDTDTIIKNYIETHYGVIDRETQVDDKETLKEPNGDETEVDTEVTEKEPIEKSTDVKAMDESYTSVEDAKRKLGNNWPTYQDDVAGEYLPIPTRDEYERMWDGEDRSQYANTSYEGFLNALVDSGELTDEELYNILLNDNTMEEELEDTGEDAGVDISDDLQEDAKSETGTSSFYKIRQRDSVNIDSLLEKASQGINSQESEYIVVKEVNLTPEEMQEVTSNLSKPQAFLQGVEPIDRKNYPFNVVKVTSESSPYTLLIDNVGYNYPRYVSVIQ